MAVMVTGGLGVIGSLTARRLLELGHKCLIIDNRVDDTSLVADLLPDMPVEACDITDLAQLVDAMRRHQVDRVIHTAALIDGQQRERPPRMIAVNVEGTVNMFEAARLLGLKRVVFCSTRGVYQGITGRHAHPFYDPISEDYPKIEPSETNSLYDATKQFTEHLAVVYRTRYGLDFVCLRFGTTFSFGKQARHGTVSLVSRMVENAVDGVATAIPSGGDQKNDFVYNKDTANALVLGCLAEQPVSRFYHIGSGRAATLQDIAAAIRQQIPSAQIEVGPGLDFYGLGKQIYAIFDISRARTELGYSPRFTLEAAVADYIATVRRLRQAARPVAGQR